MTFQQDTASHSSSTISIGAMAFAKKVAEEFNTLETGYRKGLYRFFANALTAYKKFLKDPEDYKELLRHENIAKIREKPKLKETSRLVLYLLTNAKSGDERETASRHAHVVDYLYREGIDSAAVVEHIQSVGGKDEILKKVRKNKAPKTTDDTQQDSDRDFDQEKETADADDSASSDAADELFDPERDLAIRLKPEALAKVLGSEVPTNELFYLECRKTGSVGDGGVLIEGRLFNPK